MLDVLIEEGYQYDSSLNPILFRFLNAPHRWSLHQHWHETEKRALWEVPISTSSFLGVRVAIAGGNYIRQLPHSMLSYAVQRRTLRGPDPVVFYFMPWELDTEQPHIQGLSALDRVRHYRNLAKTRKVLEEYFDQVSLRRHLRLLRAYPRATSAAREARVASRRAADGRPRARAAKTPSPSRSWSPCTTKGPTSRTSGGRCSRFERGCRRVTKSTSCSSTIAAPTTPGIFWRPISPTSPGCSTIRHPENRGVAAAIMTGIRNAPTEIVCSIDCDCSYDPSTLARMIPLLQNADMVTASPYHPQGSVRNVPGWRLVLSKTLSRSLQRSPLRPHSYVHELLPCL